MITKFQIFENRRNQPYKSPSLKRKEAIDKTNKYKEFIPGAYIVFRYSNEIAIQFFRKNSGIDKTDFDDIAVIARIININEIESDKRYDPVYYLEATPVKYQIFNSFEKSIIEFDKLKKYNLNYVSDKYITTSLLDAEEKYNELVDKMSLKYDVEKYNL